MSLGISTPRPVSKLRMYFQRSCANAPHRVVVAVVRLFDEESRSGRTTCRRPAAAMTSPCRSGGAFGAGQLDKGSEQRPWLLTIPLGATPPLSGLPGRRAISEISMPGVVQRALGAGEGDAVIRRRTAPASRPAALRSSRIRELGDRYRRRPDSRSPGSRPDRRGCPARPPGRAEP